MINLILTNLANLFQHLVNNIFNAVMQEDLFSILLSGLQQGSIDGNKVYIPGLTDLGKLLRVIGWVVYGISVMLFLLQTMGLIKQSKSPLGTLIRMVMAAFLIQNSDVIYKLISSLTTNIYSLFTAIWTGKSTVSTELIKLTISLDIQENFMQFCFMLAISAGMLTAIAAYLERVVLLCIFIYFYPVALGFAASEDGMETFIDWAKGIFSQVFAILLSYALLYMGMQAATKGVSSGISLGVVSIDASLDVLNIVKNTSMIVGCLVAIILFSSSAGVDKLLAMFQIKTMKVGDAGRALHQAILQGKGMATMVGGAAVRIFNKAPVPSAVTNNVMDASVTGLGSGKSFAGSQSGDSKINPVPMTKENGQERPITNMEQQAKRSANVASASNMYKFDADGKMISSPDRKMREQMAVDSGIIQPATTGKQMLDRVFPITPQAIENRKRISNFNKLMDGYATEQFAKQKNLKDNFSAKNIQPMMKDADGNPKVMTYKDIAEATNIPSIKDFKVDQGESVGWKDGYGNIAYQISGTDTRTGKKESYIIGADSGTGKYDFKVTNVSDINSSIGMNADGELFDKQLSRGEAHREGGFSINENLYAYKLDKVDSYAYNSKSPAEHPSLGNDAGATYDRSANNSNWISDYANYKHIDFEERGMGDKSSETAINEAVNKKQEEKTEKAPSENKVKKYNKKSSKGDV